MPIRAVPDTHAGPPPGEQLDGLRAVPVRGGMHRSFAVLVDSVDGYTPAEQQVDQLVYLYRLAGPGSGQHDCRPALVVLRQWVGTDLHQGFRKLNVASLNGPE